MVEAKGRKAAFLRETIRALRLPDVVVENVRLEQLFGPSTADVVTVRAVKLDGALGKAVRNLLKRDGMLAVFGSSEASLPGFVADAAISLVPDTPAVLTVLRVPRGT